MGRIIPIVSITFFISLLVAAVSGYKISIYLGLLMILLFSVSLLIKESRKYKIIPLALAVASLAFFYSSLYTNINVTPVETALDDKDYYITAKLIELPTSSNGKYYYTFESSEIDDKDKKVKFRLSTSNVLDIKPYDTLNARVHFYLANEGNNAFDFRINMKSRGIYIQAFLYEYENYKISAATSFEPYYYAIMARQKVIESIDSMLPRDEASLIIAMMMGDKQYISDKISDDFTAAGVNHILVISGLHVSIISQLLYSVFSRIKRLPMVFVSLLTILGILIFMVISGLTPSVVRSGMMIIILQMGLALGRKADSLNSLAIAALIILLPNPLAAGDISLILSFFATLGIVVFSKKVYNFIRVRCGSNVAKNPVFCAFNEAVSVTVASTIFTLPFIMLSFGTVSLISILGNLLLVYPSSILLGLSIITILIYLTGLQILAMPFDFIVYLFCKYMIVVVDILSRIPFATISATAPHMLISAALVIMITGVFIIPGCKRLYKFIAIFSVIILIGCFATHEVLSRNITKIAVLNGAKGASVVITKGNRAGIISCAGGKGSGSIINNYLKANNVTDLDYVVLPDVKWGAGDEVARVMERCKTDMLITDANNKFEDRLTRSLNNVKNISYFNDKISINTSIGNEIEVDTSTGKSIIAAKIDDVSFLVFQGEVDSTDLPNSYRSCDFLIVNKLPKYAENINAFYTVFTIPESSIIDKQIGGRLPKTYHLTNTATEGNIIISITDGKANVLKE